MALLRLDSFPDIRLSDTIPIGSVEGRLPVKLSVSTTDPETKRLVFLEHEIAATWGVDPKTIPVRAVVDGEETILPVQWWRVEVQVASDHPEIKKGMELVIARQLAACWTASAPFKKADKKGRGERPDPLDGLFSDSESAIERLESLSYDFWEKNDDYLTAGISIPPDPFSEKRRNYSRGAWYLGVCENMRASTAALWTDSHVLKLLDMAQKKQLRFWPSSFKIDNRYGEYHPRLRDEVDSLMVLAIRQSLAGPMKDTEEFLGKPVATLVERYFKDTMYNFNRSYWDGD